MDVSRATPDVTTKPKCDDSTNLLVALCLARVRVLIFKVFKAILRDLKLFKGNLSYFEPA